MNTAGATLPGVILDKARTIGDRTLFGALTADGGIRRTTWREGADRALAVAAALRARGFAAGDRGAIYAYNSPDWYTVDFAVQFLAGVSVPVYMNSTGEQVAYVLEDSGAKLVYVDTAERLATLSPHLGRLAKTCAMVVLSEATAKAEATAKQVGGDLSRFVTLESLEREGTALGPSVAEAIAGEVASIDSAKPATLSYTSGTTGEPKGVILSHANVLGMVEACAKDVGLERTPGDRTISYLPLAHIAQRMMDVTTFWFGSETYFPTDILKVLEAFKVVRPTYLVAVPRILEKVKSGIENKVAEAPPRRQRVFAWATRIAYQVADRGEARRPLGPGLAAKRFLADRLVFRKIRAALGGEVENILAGGAPVARDLGRFFYGIGIPVYEVFGLTETTAVISYNRPGEFRYGTVGKPTSLGEVRIAPDGEILYRGPNVFLGYWRKEAATAEALEGGWFHSGDVGEFDSDGYLKITGRKKELIVTSAGKNVAPIPIEFAVQAHPLVDQVMVIGDERNYLTALVTLNFEEARRRFGATMTNEELTRLEPLRSAIATHVDEVNRRLARYEQVKKFEILAAAWTPDGGELTPSMKLRRRVVMKKYADQIERMYRESAARV